MKNEPGHIIHYYFKRLNKNARGIEKDFNEETIHLFRVDVKKLRAFLRMMRLEAEEPGELKFPPDFKKMYSLTGKIRDRQLYQKRLTESNKTRGNRLRNKISSLKKELAELMKKQNEILTKKEFADIEEKMIKVLHGKVSATLVKKFFLQKLSISKEIIAKADYKDKELHSLRKCFKDIIYIIRIFRDNIKKLLPFIFWDKAELKKTEDLSHTLGLFNDSYIALSFLSPADIRKTETAEKELLLLLRRQWLADKLKQKKEILNKIPAIKFDMLC